MAKRDQNESGNDHRDVNMLKEPPSNIKVEQALLGAIMQRSSLMESVSDFLKAEMFHWPLHEMIFMMMMNLSREQKPISSIAINAMLKGMDLYDDAGGMTYTVSLLQAAPVVMADQVRHNGEMIMDLSIRRHMIEHSQELIGRLYAPAGEETVKEIIEDHETALAKVTAKTDPHGGLVSLAKIMPQTLDSWEQENRGSHGVTTGYPDVDQLLGGLHPTDLIVMAGRPSMGKTALGTAIAFNAAHFFEQSKDLEFRGKSVAFFSLEMDAKQLGSRIITGQTAIQSPRNRWGKNYGSSEWQQIMESAARWGQLPFYVDDDAGMTVHRMRARCMRLHRKRPIGLIVVDYIQLIEGELKGNQAGKRVEEVSAITRGLKKLAKELKVPVLALSQLSRAVESREDKRPILSDLRESGSIEQDADIVVFPFRPEYYLRQQGEPQRTGKETDEAFMSKLGTYQAQLDAAENKCELIVAKQRHGPLGSANLYFASNRTWFDSMQAPEIDPQGDLL